MAVEIRGAEQLVKLSQRLKELGDKGLQKELYAGINRAVKPVKADIKQSALARLPHRNGLAAKAARTPLRTQRRTSARVAGVRLVAMPGKLSRTNLAALDRGFVRHPVFADSSEPRRSWTWVNQPVTPGWWSKPTEAAAPQVRRDVEAAMFAVAVKLSRPL